MARNTSPGPEYSVSAEQSISKEQNGNAGKEEGAREVLEESYVQQICKGPRQVHEDQITRVIGFHRSAF